ncbi:MAG: hypothetical protein COC19_00140 [SAR86 cluster bacterium]|uniref:Uncharacterized protein n=1 Tax=SAR86 cluster bacterium TaxID=2030880 RepID=A0A2A4MVI2_9GAMM|nr:MAG: hypothetical protein COC19_00140 [SAR86 cluster bacterium]
MLELQRQAYLKTLGIACYFPTQVLPGAKASPLYDLSTPMSDSVAGAMPTELVIAQSQAGKQPLTQGTGLRPGRKANGTVSTAQPSHSAQSKTVPVLPATPIASQTNPQLQSVNEADATAQLRFSLRYLRITDELVVLDEVPYLQAGKQNPRAKQLLQAILTALAVDYSACHFESESFNWPVAAMPTASDSEMARQALRGFLHKRFEQHGFSYVLGFCGQVDALLRPAGNEDGACSYVDAQLGFHATLTKSLHAMLSVPSLKQSVWQDLQVLRGKLAQRSN